MNKLCVITVLLLMMVSEGWAQKKKSTPGKSVPHVVARKKELPPSANPNDPTSEEKKIKDMVSFLEFLLNTLGNNETSPRDKDVVVTESYSKIFRDAKVQIEDDLTENRSVITNKDVVAYLKDINFFFKEVRFEFNIDKVEHGINAGHQTFYKITITRNLKGTTAEGKPINNISPRFIEVNFDPKKQDLKIVSIYTHEYDEKTALLNWWRQLSFEWQSIFRKKFSLMDSITYDDLHRLISMEKLDLSNNGYLQNFDPLMQLRNLKTIDLSYTDIHDLSPIRNLTDLTELNLSHTPTQNLSPLKYCIGLQALNISDSEVRDVGVLERMPKLQFLDLSHTKISDFGPVWKLNELLTLNVSHTRLTDFPNLENMTRLTELNISNTSVHDISSITSLSNLKVFICDTTGIKIFNAIAGLTNLKIFQTNATSLPDLQPLSKLPKLEKVYCDQTKINKASAEAFMATHPGMTVVYDSRSVRTWWDSLTPSWKKVIMHCTKINNNPSDEDLARIGNIDSINVGGNDLITDFEPLRKFQKLRVLIAAHTGIQDLSPLKDHKEIASLDISGTHVTDLSPAGHFNKLKILKADHCNIASIDALEKLPSIQKLYVDGTTTNDINAREFLAAKPKCLLIYKTVHLKHWWFNLSDNWKSVFRPHMEDTTRESLHKLIEQVNFTIKDAPVPDLSTLSEFVRLEELHISSTALTGITPLENLKTLKSLHVTSSPIQEIETIGFFADLEDLDISNTPLTDLTPVWALSKLKKLNCAGTQIRRLEGLEKLESIESLDCSNTNVSKLTPLDYLHLKSLKCYNTRVTSRTIKNFIASHPECKVVYYR